MTKFYTAHSNAFTRASFCIIPVSGVPSNEVSCMFLTPGSAPVKRSLRQPVST